VTLILRWIGWRGTGRRQIDDDFFGRDFDDLAVLPGDDEDAQLLVKEAGVEFGAIERGINCAAISTNLLNVNVRLQAANHIGPLVP
jgi:hypothetical protein